MLVNSPVIYFTFKKNVFVVTVLNLNIIITWVERKERVEREVD